MVHSPLFLWIRQTQCILTALLIFASGTPLLADWRKDLLKEHCIGLDQDSLKKASQQEVFKNEDLEEAFKALGSDQFADRENAQQTLSEMGEAILDFLDAKQPINDPEIRFRVEKIREAVSSGVETRMAPIIRWAAKTLLDKPNDVATGGWFFEWFHPDKADCLDGYRNLKIGGARTQKPFVKNGRLNVIGRHKGEEDQRMSLLLEDWPGVDRMPDQFEVSCLMGGEAGGAGAWHAALCIGKVKVLFHPGYRGGGFRFEQVGTLEQFSKNQDMGFTPEFGKLYRMNLVVARFPSGRVGIQATVISPDGKSFESHIHVEAEDVGPLDRISMERSGRIGGNAIFDDFMVKIRH